MLPPVPAGRAAATATQFRTSVPGQLGDLEGTEAIVDRLPGDDLRPGNLGDRLTLGADEEERMAAENNAASERRSAANWPRSVSLSGRTKMGDGRSATINHSR